MEERMQRDVFSLRATALAMPDPCKPSLPLLAKSTTTWGDRYVLNERLNITYSVMSAVSWGSTSLLWLPHSNHKLKSYGIWDLEAPVGALVHNYLCTHDLYGPVRNVFDACRSITWATARCHFTGPKKVSISRAQPPPLALVASKT
jgi:hypothetical protein